MLFAMRIAICDHWRYLACCARNDAADNCEFISQPTELPKGSVAPGAEIGDGGDLRMSYTVTITRNDAPAEDEAAWVWLRACLKQEAGEQADDFLALVERFKAVYPCICDLPDDKADEGVWSDGPLSNNAGNNAATLGMVFSAVDTVLPFLVATSNEAGFTVFDYQTKTIYRPHATVGSTGATRPESGKSFLRRLFGG